MDMCTGLRQLNNLIMTNLAIPAMDSEEGVEVVWNEAQFSSGKKFKAQEVKLTNVFEALTLIDHPNIVKVSKEVLVDLWRGFVH
jgi:hypothetical protein